MEKSLVGAIFAAYADLRLAQARQEAQVREPRILFYAFLVGFLLFVIGLPTARMQAGYLDVDNAYAIVLSARFFGAMFVLPLLFYGFAAMTHILALVFGGQASFQTHRLSLFWALLVTMPVLILTSAAAVGAVGLTGHSMNILGLIVLLAFAKIWGEGLAQAEKFAHSWPIILLIAALPIATFLTIASNPS